MHPTLGEPVTLEAPLPEWAAAFLRTRTEITGQHAPR